MALPPMARWAVAVATAAFAVASLRQVPARTAADGAEDVEPEVTAAVTKGKATMARSAAQAAAPMEPTAALRRELRAVAVLYAATCLLPWGIGAAFQP
jgi:hypothetical protein